MTRGFLVNNSPTFNKITIFKILKCASYACHMYVISSLEITKDACASNTRHFPPKIVPARNLQNQTGAHYCDHICTRCPNESSLPPTFENEAAYLGYPWWKGEMIQSFPTKARSAPMTNPATDLIQKRNWKHVESTPRQIPYVWR